MAARAVGRTVWWSLRVLATTLGVRDRMMEAAIDTDKLCSVAHHILIAVPVLCWTHGCVSIYRYASLNRRE